MISVRDVGVELDGRRVLDGVSLDICAGEVLVIVGPNGAGKSTLLAVLSGERHPDRGSVRYGDRDVREIRSSELARLRAVLTQENSVSFPFRVSEVVAMGRAPWSRYRDSADDAEAIAEALELADVAALADRRYPALSGGERARVSLARVLAQRTDVVFLDEPTASLDLGHQEAVMALARSAAAAQRAVVVVLHDLALAAAYADRILLLAAGRVDALGTPTEVLTAERVERVYGVPVDLIEVAGRPLIVPRRA